MFQNALLTVLAGIGLGASFSSGVGKPVFREATQPRRHRQRFVRNPLMGDVVPRGYPGAKLARKAMNGTVGRATLR